MAFNLPVLTISIAWIHYISRLVRASMIEVLSQNHVRMARAFDCQSPSNEPLCSSAVLPSITMMGVSVAFIIPVQ